MPSEYPTFRERFCERFRCTPSDFELTVLWELLDPLPCAFGKLLARVKPEVLETDRRILRRVSRLDSVPDVLVAVQDLEKEYAARSDFGPLRKIFKLRVSRDRLLKLTAQLWRRDRT
jgi:hypothetical protein